MQVLNAPPRDTLTAAEVTALLTGDRVQVDFGAEVLNLDLTSATAYGTAGDISSDVAGGSVSRRMFDKIHGTCRLSLSTELPWGNVLVRPYMTLTDVVTARFNLGAYMVTTPVKPVGETPITFDCQGMDRLYLLDREIGATYTVTSGTSYYTALAAVFTAAGLSGYQIEGTAGSYTLPSTAIWPLVGTSTSPDQTTTPVTYLRVLNELLSAINFRGVWCDQDGFFRCQQYVAPTSSAPEFALNADNPSVSILGEKRTLTADQWSIPNRWVFRWTNRPGGMSTTEGDGIYTYNLPSPHPMSATSRGLTWTTVIDYDAASQAVLQSLGDRRVAADLRVTALVNATTGPLPAAGHFDVFTLTDSAVTSVTKMLARQWDLPLNGGDMTWLFEAIT